MSYSNSTQKTVTKIYSIAHKEKSRIGTKTQIIVCILKYK